MPIEQVAPECEYLIDLKQEVEWLGHGFGAEKATIGKPDGHFVKPYTPRFNTAEGSPWWPAEGPVWWHEGGYLLFSDIGQNKRLKWTRAEGVTTFSEPTNRANGMTRDIQGRLVTCEHATQRVTRLEQDGSITVIADRYKGKRLNRPNDVVVKSDGSIYFTDPYRPNHPNVELDFSAVWRVSADLKTLTLLIDDLLGPNGLCFSPSERLLYVSDSRDGFIKAYDVLPDGAVANGRLYCVLMDERPGMVDGIKVDTEGNVYSCGPGGIWIVDPSGKHLATIPLGEGRRATNVGWGGDDWKTLFITTFHDLACVRMKIPGISVPRKF